MYCQSLLSTVGTEDRRVKTTVRTHVPDFHSSYNILLCHSVSTTLPNRLFLVSLGPFPGLTGSSVSVLLLQDVSLGHSSELEDSGVSE